MAGIGSTYESQNRVTASLRRLASHASMARIEQLSSLPILYPKNNPSQESAICLTEIPSLNPKPYIRTKPEPHTGTHAKPILILGVWLPGLKISYITEWH